MNKERGTWVRLDGLHTVVKKDAKTGKVRATYYYAWRGGPRLDPNNLRESYEEAHRKRKEERTAASRGTSVAALMVSYKESDSRGVAQKRNIAFAQEILVSKFGHFDVAAIADRRMRGDIISELEALADTPRKADFLAQEATRFANWLYDRGKINAHAWSDLPRQSNADYSAIMWEPEEVAAVMAELPNDNARRFFGFMVETGLDGCDVRRLTWGHVKPHSVEIVRAKSIGPNKKEQLAAPALSDEARRILSECDRGQLLVFPNTKGRAYQNFSGQFQRAKKAAGIEGKRLKDTRGTACAKFCRIFPDDAAIAQMMGWSEQNVRTIRQRYVSRDEIARIRSEQITKADCKPPVNRTKSKAAKSQKTQ